MRINPHHVAITRDPQYGVAASLGPDTDPAAREVLLRAGFRPLADGRLTIDAAPDQQNLFLHVRQTVAFLRHSGVQVEAAEEFDYTAASRPSLPSPAQAAAGATATVQAAAPARTSGFDVAIGRHPRLGIVARNLSDSQEARLAFAEAGFVRTDPRSDLYALDEPEFEGEQRATSALRTLRDKGLRVAAELDFEPLDGPYVPTDPFATRLIAAMDRTPPSPAPSPAPERTDPFATRLIAPEDRAPAPPARAASQSDPFGTVVHTGPSAQDRGADALLHDRVAMNNEVAASLRAINAQLRADPAAVDFSRVESVIAQADTVLAGNSRDLAAVAARPAAASARSGPTSPRARAALATGGRVRSSAALHAQNAASAVPAVDPRIQWAAGHSNSL
ncbi:hypothetical protein [Kitasatospora sp. NRRL B-11411]|uniref:hypothetical protein n=1 Tax=Kitasatospora sp. NRRL B-11411 TaxID=1463822 RepID=UPI0004C34C80|nr:hypothetical protein [Kitasatospora sp. NRRL B-11411]